MHSLQLPKDSLVPSPVPTNELAHDNSKYVFQLSMVGPHGGGNGARVSKRFTLPGRNANFAISPSKYLRFLQGAKKKNYR